MEAGEIELRSREQLDADERKLGMRHCFARLSSVFSSARNCEGQLDTLLSNKASDIHLFGEVLLSTSEVQPVESSARARVKFVLRVSYLLFPGLFVN